MGNCVTLMSVVKSRLTFVQTEWLINKYFGPQ